MCETESTLVLVVEAVSYRAKILMRETKSSLIDRILALILGAVVWVLDQSFSSFVESKETNG